MTPLDLIRLIWYHRFLIASVPVVLAVSVYMATEDMPESFSGKTMVYTGFASGFTLESTGGKSVDRFLVNSAFDNLINTIESKQTFKEVSLRLLANHLSLEQADSNIIGERAYTKLGELLPEAQGADWVVKGNAEATFKKMQAVIRADMNHPLKQLLASDAPYYSIKALSKISSSRIASSDMVEIGYASDDSGICRQTLEILLEVFIKKYKFLKASETGDVVAYFQKELAKVQGQLNGAEANMKDFRERGRILNYYEQTKAIAVKKEDISDEYTRSEGQWKAAERVLAQLESKLNISRDFLSKNQDILQRKQRLSELSTQLALQNINQQNKDDVEAMQREAERLKTTLQQDMVSLYGFTHSTQGVPIGQLLESWLDHLIEVEVHQAKTLALGQRLAEIDELYDEFAPLGSGLKKLEREIGVHERSYLQILHDLNLALLRQQNIEISSNVTIVDHPEVESLGSKRLILVVLAFLVGAISMSALVIALELLDSSIKTPERAKKMLKLPLVSAYPLYTRAYRKRSQRIEGAMMRHNLSRIQKALVQKNAQAPYLLVLFSTQEREGKTKAGQALAERYREVGWRVLHLTPTPNEEILEDQLAYRENEQLLKAQTVNDLLKEPVRLDSFDYIFLELPALNHGLVPLTLVKDADLMLLTIRANRVWNGSDKRMLKDFVQDLGVEPHLLLNGVRPDRLEGILGDLKSSSKKTLLKRIVRRIIRLELKVNPFK